jgi:hypothetical protein
MLRETLLRQFDIAWALASYHLEGLSDEECLWRPAAVGLHVHRTAQGWQADWPEHEGYDLGPPSIAWTTWHICFWWSMVFANIAGDESLSREGVAWPGSAERVRAQIVELQERWRAILDACDEGDLRSVQKASWPIPDRPFADIAAWLNVELMKNAAEIGFGRFLYAAAHRSPNTTVAALP